MTQYIRGRARGRQFSTARIRAMLEQFLEDPNVFTAEQRRLLVDGLVPILERIEDDPIIGEAMIGVREVAAYLDGPHGGESREA
jgi:hypothetical protein